jgi:hypothetical protein
MSDPSVHRRDFSRLSLAAFGGVVTGVTAWGQTPPPPIAPPRPIVPPSDTPAAAESPTAKADGEKSTTGSDDVSAKAAKDKAADAKKKKDGEKPKEIHICRGLNYCKGQGKSGTNECAGRGDCATTPTSPHECATGNACKNLGGCGPTAGKNQCAGYGDGSVPLLEEEWPRLRAEFEYKMKRLRREIGPAPLSENEIRWKRRWEEAHAKALAEIEAKKKAEAEAAKNPKARKKPRDSGNVQTLDELTGEKNKDKK